MKIVFIDVDGPLMPARMYIYGPHPGFDPVCVKFLLEIIHRCNAKLVACTTHAMRGKEYLFNLFETNGIDTSLFHDDWSIGKIGGNSRTELINAWLEKHKPDRYCIIDDAKIDNRKVVRVNAEVGISPSDYRKATEMLGNPDPFVVLV